METYTEDSNSHIQREELDFEEWLYNLQLPNQQGDIFNPGILEVMGLDGIGSTEILFNQVDDDSTETSLAREVLDISSERGETGEVLDISSGRGETEDTTTEDSLSLGELLLSQSVSTPIIISTDIHDRQESRCRRLMSHWIGKIEPRQLSQSSQGMPSTWEEYLTYRWEMDEMLSKLVGIPLPSFAQNDAAARITAMGMLNAINDELQTRLDSLEEVRVKLEVENQVLSYQLQEPLMPCSICAAMLREYPSPPMSAVASDELMQPKSNDNSDEEEEEVVKAPIKRRKGRGRGRGRKRGGRKRNRK